MERLALPARPKPKGRVSSGKSKDKGKGKAPVRDWADVADTEPDDTEGADGYATANGADAEPRVNGHRGINGDVAGKGKGKGRVAEWNANPGTDGFGDASMGDDEELYG